MTIIAEYSPNIRWGQQHIELVLKQWAYAATFVIDVGGNCTGFGVLETAIGSLYDKLPEDEHGAVYLELTRGDGDTLRIEDDDGRGEDWLKDMIVSASVIGWTPPTVNEIRAMNGAKPLPDGDRPWTPL